MLSQHSGPFSTSATSRPWCSTQIMAILAAVARQLKQTPGSSFSISSQACNSQKLYNAGLHTWTTVYIRNTDDHHIVMHSYWNCTVVWRKFIILTVIEQTVYFLQTQLLRQNCCHSSWCCSGTLNFYLFLLCSVRLVLEKFISSRHILWLFVRHGAWKTNNKS